MHTVLVYHTISSHALPLESNIDIDPQRFKRHMKFLARRRARVVSLDSLLDANNGRREIAITFDDGFRDNLTTALPVLEKYDFPMAVFVATDFIGKPGYLSEPEIRELSEHPLVTIGSHGLSHRHFPLLDDDEARFELIESKRRLENITQKNIDFFAWSFGDCNPRLEKMIEECGYRAAWSVWNGNNTRYSLWRVPLGRDDNLLRFMAKLSRFYFPVKRRLKPPAGH